MLIDSTHKKWALVSATLGVAALAGYLWAGQGPYAPLLTASGGKVLRLWFGILGSALMVYAGLLAGHRHVPRRWSVVGARKTWLRGHIWLGLLSVVLIVCHSGFGFGGLLTQALWAVFALVILTGIFGLALQQLLPRLITLRVPSEAPFEQIPHLCLMMRRRADTLIESLCGPPAEPGKADDGLDEGTKAQLQQFYDKFVRPFLHEEYLRSSPLANPIKAEAVFSKIRTLSGVAAVKDRVGDLEVICQERRQLGEQERLHHLLHGWLLVHVPLSVALLVLGVAHVIMSFFVY